jgi:hypothetical protein
MGSKCHDLHVSRVFVVQVLYGKQLHPDQLKAALGSTAPAPAAPAATAVGIGPTGPHHTQQQRITVRRVTRRSVPIVCLPLHSPIFSLNASQPQYGFKVHSHIQYWSATVRRPYTDPAPCRVDSHIQN